LKPSEGKRKVFYGTASLIERIGGEGSKRFIIITAAHNFIMIEGDEELDFFEAMFVL